MSIFTRQHPRAFKAFRTYPLAAGIALLLALASLVACPGGDSGKLTPETPWEPVSPASVEPALDTAEEMNSDMRAIDFVQPALIGWNLGNQLDASNNGIADETAWGNPAITQELLDTVADAGFGIVRIPITWLGHIGDAASGYKVDEAWLARVAEVAGYVHTAGMKAIINIHHDGADSQHWLNIVDSAADAEDRTRIDDMFAAVWTQIANYFRNHGDWLIFEGVNEIHDGGWGWGANLEDGGLQYAILNQWNQSFVDSVRATGGNNATRYLTVAGYVTSPKLTMDHLVLPTDSASNRLIVTVHYYDPHSYAIAAEFQKWGEAALALEEADDYGNESDVQSLFNRLKTTYIDKGIPVYLGEYGAVHQAGFENYRRYYMEYVTKAAKDRGIVPIYWDNGASASGKECFGLFNRSTFTVYSHASGILDAMMKAANDDYTLAEVPAP